LSSYIIKFLRFFLLRVLGQNLCLIVLETVNSENVNLAQNEFYDGLRSN